MPIRPPKRFKVLGQAHAVSIVADPPEGWVDTAMGGNDLELQRVFILRAMSQHQQMDTYLHEVLHSIFFISDLRHHVSDDEPLIAALAPQLLHFLRDNPQVVKYLTQPVVVS